MSGGGQRLVLVLLAVIVGSCLACGFGSFAYVQVYGEPVTETYREPPSAIVRQNHFYAAERFLTLRGVETESAPTLVTVDLESHAFDVLLLLDDRRPLPKSRAGALADWIESGGHLICVAPAPDEDEEPQQDPLLERYEIETTYTWASYSDGESGEGEVGPLGGATEVEFVPERGLVMPFSLGDADWVWTAEDGTTHGLSLAVGEGRLTVVSDAQIWRTPVQYTGGGGLFGWDSTPPIDAKDHAELLWELVSAWGEPSRAILVYDDAYPSLWTLLVKHAWPLLISLGVLVAVWLLGASRRFGPLLLPLPLGRRSLLEHLEAAGYFMWRQDAQRPLIEASRDALRAVIRRRRAHLAHLPDDQLVPALAADLGLAHQTVHHALCAPIPHRAEGFTLLVADVERLRRAL
ncbi:MAG: DUF4350 domain-containing protein [Planctomycetota bacterium]